MTVVDRCEAQPRRVYFGNLDYKVSAEELQRIISESTGGVANADVPRTRGGRSKGFGLVDFKDETAAKKAVDLLNDSLIAGRKVFVRPDRGERKRLDEEEEAADKTPVDDESSPKRGKVRRSRGGRRRANNREDRAEDDEEAVEGEEETKGRRRRAGAGTRRRAPEVAPADPNEKGRLLYVGNLAWSVDEDAVRKLIADTGSEVERVTLPVGRSGRLRGYASVLLANASDLANCVTRLHDTEFEGRKLLVREDRAFREGEEAADADN